MSATVTSKEPAALSTVESEVAVCECCSMTEECTPAYISRVRDRHGGRWVCGLCEAAVEDEINRSELCISAEEAVQRHASFCETFRSSPPPHPASSAEHLISAMRQLVRRSLDSPRMLRSVPSSPRSSRRGENAAAALARSESCFPTIA